MLPHQSHYPISFLQKLANSLITVNRRQLALKRAPGISRHIVSHVHRIANVQMLVGEILLGHHHRLPCIQSHIASILHNDVHLAANAFHQAHKLRLPFGILFGHLHLALVSGAGLGNHVAYEIFRRFIHYWRQRRLKITLFLYGVL